MPIFCADVNRAGEENLVPITRQNGASIGPDKHVNVLERAAMGPENGPFWESERYANHLRVDVL
jgi:hypothetical protein